MRKGLLILGIVILILGIIALGFGAVAYGSFLRNSQQIASGAVSDNVTNQLLVSTQISDAIAGFIGGVIFFIVGLVLTIIGFKGKSKKEKSTEQ